MAAFTRGRNVTAALDAAMRDLYRRAVLALPDEDVLVGTGSPRPPDSRCSRGSRTSYHAPTTGRPVRSVPGAAWLAKRFGADGQLDDRTFVIKGDGDAAGLFDYDPQEPLGESEALAGLFTVVDGQRRDSLVAFGWAMAEALAASTLPV